MTLWRPGREDLGPALLIALLPAAAAMPQLLGWLQSDPLLYVGHMSLDIVEGAMRGVPMIDPNHGFQTQALGRLAALEWLRGEVPWWNPYSGVGLPLAAEYQPAAFFPLTFLLLLPHGTAWQQIALQAIAGLGSYALLRQVGTGRAAATAGGLLFAFDGTLAWFAHTPSQALAALPWTLYGIERACAKSALGTPGGWRVLAIAMAASLLGGSPEVAYIDGLLALAWSIVRGFAVPRAARARYAARIAAGGCVALALTAPQWVAFFEYLPHAFLGTHDDFSRTGLVPHAAIPSLVAPYVYGPIFGYVEQWPMLFYVWGAVGGYVGILVVALAAYGFVVRRDAIAWLLVAWCVLALGKTFLVEPAVTLWNLVPAIPISAFFRYAQPSWALCLVLLAAFAIDDRAKRRAPHRAAWWSAAGIAFIALGASIAFIARAWSELLPHVALRNSALGSLVWAVATTAALLTLMRRATGRAVAAAIALMVADAFLLFSIPPLSSPRAATADLPAIDFLRRNLGLQRFYTLGPIQPNYGAYFGIASINHNYLPVASAWTSWMRRHLDAGADEVVFNGDAARAKGLPTAAAELRRNLSAFEWVGVKYVVADAGDDPLAGLDLRRVYADRIIAIFELPGPKPYFEPSDARCTVEARDRTHAAIDCPAPATLVRRELFFPGWKATVGGADAAIAAYRDLFQSIEVPAGRSDVRYSYAPPGIDWAWLASAAALAALVARRPRASARNSTQGAKASDIGTTGDK